MMTMALILSDYFINILMYFRRFCKASICLHARQLNNLGFSYKLSSRGFYKLCLIHLYYCFCLRRISICFFTIDWSVMFFFLLNVSVSLGLRSSSIRSFVRSLILLSGQGRIIGKFLLGSFRPL